jgi:uncharacterized protein (TIGR02421 family)
LKTLTPELQRYVELDVKLVEAARHIKVLSSLGWPAKHYDDFIQGWEAGQPKLPQVEYPKFDLIEHRRALQAIVRECDPSHPVGRYLLQTARSYMVAARMLESIGTAEFRSLSETLYGRPKDKIGKLSNLKLADDFIKITSDFAAAITDDAAAESAHCVLPEVVAAEMRLRADAFFGSHKVDIVIDPNLASKAAAGSERVRLRGRTSFSRAEIDQLLEHELFVHSATMLNGRGQPYLKSLGLGSPRTTGTQEGLATFAELITATMDLSRLRRIAMRIKAIHLGCEGGDFIDVFKFFLDNGQTQKESFQSTARIFRGGDVRGRHVFTKDVVYLMGLVSVHTFLRKAIERRKIDFPRYLFIGRVALGDVISLESFIADGFIAAPQYMPRWVANREGLAAYLSYSVFSNRLNLAEVKLEDFIHELGEAATDDVSAIA